MLPFKNRLVKRKDFEKVQRFGQFSACQNVAIKWAPNELDDTRIGFSVGLKFSKKAVERNLAKRRLREIIKARLKQIIPGLDIVVSLRRRENEKINWKKMEQMAAEALIKSQLLK